MISRELTTVLLLLIIFASFSCGKDEESSTSSDTNKTYLLEGDWVDYGTTHTVYEDGSESDGYVNGGLITFNASGEVTAWLNDDGSDVFDYLTNPNVYTTHFESYGTISSASEVTLHVVSEWSSPFGSSTSVNFGTLNASLVGSISADGRRINNLTGYSYGDETEYGSFTSEISLTLDKE